MMGSDFYFRDKIPVVVLGATTEEGQQFIQFLAHHPWFSIIALCDDESFVGQRYGEAISWLLSFPLPEWIGKMQIQAYKPSFACSLVFSGISIEKASVIEYAFAEAGYQVLAHASYSLALYVPQIVAEVNPEHLGLLEKQFFTQGKVIGTPLSMVRALTLALKPLMDFGLRTVKVVILQPRFEEDSHIGREIEHDILQILGKLQTEGIHNAPFKLNVQVEDIKTVENKMYVSIKLQEPVKPTQLIQAWHQFAEGQRKLSLPMASFHPLFYREHFQEELVKEWSVNLINLQACSALDYTFTILSPFHIRDRVRAAVLNAELLVSSGKVYW